MKKTLLLCALFASLSFATNAQDLLKKASSAASAAGFDVKSLTSGIMSKLTPKLGLTSKEKPGVTSAVSSFLGDKANILSLKQSDPASYSTKQSGLFNTLKSKLGGILLAGQMNKFLGLKPKTDSPSNILSNLFY
jgi:hypothetical protein